MTVRTQILDCRQRVENLIVLPRKLTAAHDAVYSLKYKKGRDRDVSLVFKKIK